jgi:hypothetical protein
MNEETSVELMLRSALPIDDIDQITMLPGKTIILVWIDIQDRPDLSDLAERHGQGAGTFLMTWFAAAPGRRNMIIGLRVGLEAATRVVFHLAFKVEQYLPELEILAESGQLWVVPDPPNPKPPGVSVLSSQGIIAIAGKGVQFELGPDMQAVLRDQLIVWKQHRR